MFIASDAPAQGTIASAITDYPSAEFVVAKRIQAVAVDCSANALTLNLTDFLAVDERRLIIERVDTDGSTVLAAQSYVMPLTNGRDRALTFDLDVAIHKGAAVRARMDGCDANETQWVVINYEYRNG